MLDDAFIKTAARRTVTVNWVTRFWILLFAVFVVRALFAALIPCDLVGDEAYYWDWGRRLSWGYFSKPPLIAWLMALAGWTGGNTAFGLRIWAAILGSGSMIFVFLLGRRMYGGKAGFWAAAMLAAMPGAAVLNLLLTIDAPLLFFWCAALYLLHACLHSDKGWKRTLFALALCVTLGLGHLSKQIMWAFPVLAVIYLYFDGEDSRAKLRTPLLWAVFGVSYLFLVPTLVWNAHHGWITFLHTGHHFQGDGFLSFPKNLGEFAGMQLGLLSPVLAILVFGLSISGIWSWKRIASRERFLVVFSGLPLALVLLMTLRQSMNGNWAAAFYPAGMILLAGWACTADASAFRFPSKLKSWARPGLWVAVAMSAFVYVMPVIISVSGMTGGKLDPLARLRGWDEYARQIQDARKLLPRSDAPILVAGHRYNLSELAFYLPDQPRVYHWASPGELDSQYEIWGGLDALKGHDILIVSAMKDGVLPDDLRASLAASKPVGDVTVDVGNGRMLRFSLYWASFIGAAEGAN
ncbi:MAG: glycosyltransferase family 39 protein [Opitutales bacterium]